MSVCPVPVPAELLRALAATMLADRVPAPLAFAVVDHVAGGIDVAVKPLPGSDPIGSLYGFVAPECWRAFGVVADGRAEYLGHPSPTERVRVVHLVDRSGVEINLAGGDLEIDSRVAVGRVPEICRRVLQLPTAPPSFAESALWAIDWLDRIVATVLDRDLGDNAPPFEMLCRLDRSRPRDDYPWAILRRMCADATLSLGGVAPHLASWMDDGMFSREAIAGYPDPVDLLDDLAELLPPGTVRKIRARLEALLCE